MSLRGKIIISVALFIGLLGMAGLNASFMKAGGFIQSVEVDSLLYYGSMLFASIIAIVFTLDHEQRKSR
ncbi:MAG: hypothetical protein P3T54_05440 [Dehalogenimonas sp.]|uniref:DUF3955 domain-containing protein n=1 Tax=Candidatus Dehalogenimonas loeffleri TaxID=3127115 RepID=A0ABZ2J8K0_9CHLR|nr:hypothetical protein [Dehalogenimonas sp.]